MSMNSAEYKKEITEACRQNLLESITILEEEMEMLKESASNGGEVGMSDRLESNDEEMMNERKDRENRRELLYQELRILDDLNTNEQNEGIQIGSIVISNQRNFFIAIARMFQVEGKSFTGLSEAAPIFTSMKGRTAGESFTFNGQHFDIIKVF